MKSDGAFCAIRFSDGERPIVVSETGNDRRGNYVFEMFINVFFFAVRNGGLSVSMIIKLEQFSDKIELRWLVLR